MEVRCSGCNQKYVIPDDRLRDKLSYFVCETCGETITLRPRGTGSRQAAGVSAKDILEGIYLSFNIKSLLISIAAMFCICTIIFSVLAAAGNLQVFISGWPRLAYVAGAAVALLCMFIFDLNLYMLSKNMARRVSTGRDIMFSAERPELLRDLAIVSVISIGLIAAFMLVLAPVAFLDTGWVLYAGFFYPVIVALAVILVLAQYTKGMLFAFIAMKDGSVAERIRGIFQFLGRENVNIPFYMILINIVSSFFSLLLILILAGAIMLTLAVVAVLAGLGGQGLVGQLLSQNFAALTSILRADMPLWTQAGIVLVTVFSYLLVLAAAAYCVVLYQTLTVVAVTIMESNPGRSVNRVALLVCMALPAALAAIAAVILLT